MFCRITTSIILFLISLSLLAQEMIDRKYIFFSHAYDGYYIDPRLKNIDIEQYDGIIMGGDILSEASLDKQFLESLDSLVDLSNQMTLYALGNHDSRNGNWDWVSEFTKRKTYSVHYEDQCVFIVLNTNIVPYDCEPLEEQFQLIKNTCDTISNASNLFLLMHHNIWDQVPGLSPGWSIGHQNCKYWLANCDSVNSHFYNVVYPMLVEVKNRGIEVFCMFGDLGSPGKEKFNEISSHGIHFLGSGLYHGNPEDELVIFLNTNGNIEYDWHNLDSLVLINKQ